MYPTRVLITGAAGVLGAKLTAHLRERADLVLLDLAGGTDIHQADLSVWNEDWVGCFAGVDAVVHLAGNPVAWDPWERLVAPNVDAMLHVYEAAARHGVKRMVFASSNHVMGGYKDEPEVQLTEDLPPRPGARYAANGEERFSGPYGATKLCGERVGRQYAELRGLEVIAVRIGWVWKGVNTPEGLPPDRPDWFRLMWLSDPDFLHLMDCCLTAKLPEPFLVVNGMSANTGMQWDLTRARTILGYDPQYNVHADADGDARGAPPGLQSGRPPVSSV
jgi:nucleoside-diphosphate-sugar epimerase